MKKIQLTQLQIAYVDDADYDRLVGMGSWCAQFDPNYADGGRFVAARRVRRSNGAPAMLYMHRFILEAQPGEFVDHIDGNTLNNQRDNVRIVTNSQNRMNVGRQSNNTSGRRGVSWDKDSQKWYARIKVHGKRIHLGMFDDREAASAAHEAAREKHFGQYNRHLTTASVGEGKS